MIELAPLRAARSRAGRATARAFPAPREMIGFAPLRAARSRAGRATARPLPPGKGRGGSRCGSLPARGVVVRSPRRRARRPGRPATAPAKACSRCCRAGIGSFEGLRVADLFAGTGALGLEALSRGAASLHLHREGPGRARHPPPQHRPARRRRPRGRPRPGGRACLAAACPVRPRLHGPALRRRPCPGRAGPDRRSFVARAGRLDQRRISGRGARPSRRPRDRHRTALRQGAPHVVAGWRLSIATATALITAVLAR